MTDRPSLPRPGSSRVPSRKGIDATFQHSPTGAADALMTLGGGNSPNRSSLSNEPDKRCHTPRRQCHRWINSREFHLSKAAPSVELAHPHSIAVNARAPLGTESKR